MTRPLIAVEFQRTYVVKVYRVGWLSSNVLDCKSRGRQFKSWHWTAKINKWN